MMVRVFLAFSLLVASCGPAFAQISKQPIRSGATNPATCSVAAGPGERKWFYNTSDMQMKYCCLTDAWCSVVGADGAGVLTVSSLVTSGAGVPSIGIKVVNDGATGTTLSFLAKYTGATAILAGVGDTAIPVFIVTAGAGTSGSATLAVAGQAPCAFDAATTAGNFVQVSTSAAGKCKDAGATAPTSGWVIGRVLSTNGAGGTYAVALAQGFNAGGGGAANKYVIPFGAVAGVTVDTFFGLGNFASTESVVRRPAGVAGTATAMYCATDVAPGAGNTHVFTLRKNSVSTSMTCTISNPSVSCSDVVNQPTFTATDLLAVHDDVTTSPLATFRAHCSVVYQ